MPHFRTIVFDFDGTIANTLPLIYRTFNAVVEPRIGRVLPDAEIRSHFGPPDQTILGRYVGEIEQAAALGTLMLQGWGQENPAFRQIFTSLFIPGATPAQMQWFNDLQRRTTSPENAVRIRAAMNDIDVTGLLPRLTVPTLVLHCQDDAVAPFTEGRRMAAGIPAARFVALEGRNHLMLEDEPAWVRFLDEVHAFLGTDAGD